MTPKGFNVVSAVGLTLCGGFVGGNLALSYITVPTLLLATGPTPLPPPANADNNRAPSAISLPKPVTKTSHLARQWQKVFDIGSKAGPVVAFFAAGSFLFTARQLPVPARLPKRLFVAAAGLVVSIVPFTFIVMRRTNNELHRRAEAAKRDDDLDLPPEGRGTGVDAYQTHDLVAWWANLNTLRAMLHVGAIGCVLVAINV